jgi:endonuclease/exonuclease/phosphatase family metal-dependent hydrolase
MTIVEPVSFSSHYGKVVHVTSVRFATFNAHSGKPRDSRPNLRKFRETVVALGADVIGLQEIDNGMARSGRNNYSGEAANALDAEEFFANARRRWDWGLYGNAIVAKGRIRQTEILKYKKKKFYYEQRVGQLATVIIEDQAWNVANTHLSLRGDEQVDQLLHIAERLSQRTNPNVLMGDFNMAPEVVKAAIEPEGWRVLESAHTYPSWNLDHTVDYICVQGVEVESVEVRSMEISDHAAVLATLRPQ